MSHQVRACTYMHVTSSTSILGVYIQSIYVVAVCMHNQSSQVTTGCRVVQAMQCRCTVIWRGCVGVMKGGGGEEGG